MRPHAFCVMVLCGALAGQQRAGKVLALEQTIKVEKAGFRAAEVGPLGRTVLAGTFDGHVQMWDTASRKLILRKRGDSGGFG